MKCPKCQFDLPDGAKFCPKCGHRMTAAQLAAASAPAAPGAAEAPTTQPDLQRTGTEPAGTPAAADKTQPLPTPMGAPAAAAPGGQPAAMTF